MRGNINFITTDGGETLAKQISERQSALTIRFCDRDAAPQFRRKTASGAEDQYVQWMAFHVDPLVFKFGVPERANLVYIQLAQDFGESAQRSCIENRPPISPLAKATIQIGIRILQVVPLPVSQSIDVIRKEDDQVCADIGEFLDRLKVQVETVRIQEGQRQSAARWHFPHDLVHTFVRISEKDLRICSDLRHAHRKCLMFDPALLTEVKARERETCTCREHRGSPFQHFGFPQSLNPRAGKKVYVVQGAPFVAHRRSEGVHVP